MVHAEPSTHMAGLIRVLSTVTAPLLGHFQSICIHTCPLRLYEVFHGIIVANKYPTHRPYLGRAVRAHYPQIY